MGALGALGLLRLRPCISDAGEDFDPREYPENFMDTTSWRFDSTATTFDIS